jgi:nucleoside-diphosphate-sugar epimerase
VNVLVIGGNRFVGLLATWRLLAGGHKVTLLNRGSLPDPFGDRVERLRGDRCTELEALTAGRRFDAVLDLAVYSGEDARRAAEILQSRVGHYVMVSTGQVYLVRENAPRPSREADYAGPLSPRPASPPDLGEWEYGMGKRDAEDALAAAAARGFPATRVRIPMVNGELDYHRRVEGYLWRFLDGGPVLVPDGGSHLTRHVYGGEVARFLVEILGREKAHGEVYNLAQEETPTLRQLLERLKGLLGSSAELVDVPALAIRAEVLELVGVSPFSGRWMSLLDPGRAREALGFRHEPLDGYLGKIVAAFLAHAPASPPPGYRGREAERRLVARLRIRN